MEDINRFVGGMNTDSNPATQPENTTRYMLNFVPLAIDGNVYSVTNENGTVLISGIVFPTGFQVIGYSVLNNEIIVVLAHEDGYSQVGYIQETGDDTAYTPIAPSDTIVPEDNTELGFTLEHPVDCVSRKLINGHRVLYYTDNNIPFGRIDLDSPPSVGTASSEINLVLNRTIPVITVTRLLETGGTAINPGVVQFITRYVTAAGDTTSFGIPTNPLAMIAKKQLVGVDKYAGNYYDETSVTKSAELTISNVDTTYNEIEVFAMYYEGEDATFKASRVATLPITSDTLYHTYQGIVSEEIIDLTEAELLENDISYDIAKCIEQKDNVLFLTNLQSKSYDNDATLQAVANAIKVSYKVHEIPFSNRGANVTSSNAVEFAPVTNSPMTTGERAIELEMSDEINSTSDVSTSNYKIIKPDGTVATGSVTFTAIPTDGDTITIDDTIPVTYTAKTVVSATNDFLIGATVDETATNFQEAIEDTEAFRGSVTTDTVELIWQTGTATVNGTTITIVEATPAITSIAFADGVTGATEEVPLTVTLTTPLIDFTFPTPIMENDLLVVGVDSPLYDLDDSFYQSALTGLTILLNDSDSGNTTATSQQFSDYTDELIASNYKTYRRGEILSLGLVALYKNGSYSPVYHIPGAITDAGSGTAFATGTNKVAPTATPWPTFSATDGTTARLGTYISDLEYPLNQKYPGNLTGDDTAAANDTGIERNIRHHYLPELENEPHFRVTTSGKTMLRLLNLEFDLTDLDISDGIKSTIQELLFVRERRNLDENRSVYAQGIVNRMVVTADDFDNNGGVTGDVTDDYKSAYIATEMPLFNNLESAKYDSAYNNEESGTKTPFGMAYPNYTDTPGVVGDVADVTYADSTGRGLKTEILENQLMFHSPETELQSQYDLSGEIATQAKLKSVLQLTGTYCDVGNLANRHVSKDRGSLTQYTTGVDKHGYCDYFADFTNYVTATTELDEVTINTAREIACGIHRESDIDETRAGLKTSSRWSGKGVELLTATTPKTGVDTLFELTRNPEKHSFYREDAFIKDLSTDDIATEGTLARNLYNIVVNRTSQYNSVSKGEYIPIARKTLDEDGACLYTGIYGGDTFITKFAIETANLITLYPQQVRYNAITSLSAVCQPKYSESQRDPEYRQTDGIDKGGNVQGNGEGLAAGYDIRACNYYIVESDINTHYRHEAIPVTDDSGVTPDAVEFFPNSSNISNVLNLSVPYAGYSSDYNNQYSYENALLTFYPRTSTDSILAYFENRTIYSESAADDDIVDSYRSFLQSNYYDLSSNTGPVWDTFVYQDTLFMHTPKALWKTFAETTATLEANDISDVVLGTGSLFVRPSQPVVTTSGGYGGSISQFGGVVTQMGYIYVDILQGKIFGILSGDGGMYLKDLTENTIATDMRDKLSTGLIRNATGVIDMSNVTTLNSHLIDNPFIGIGVSAGYDYALKRAWIIKHSGTPFTGAVVDTFTLSLSIILQKWYSYHSYVPNVIISVNDRTLFIKNDSTETSSIWEMNIGDKGVYFGEDPIDSQLEYVSAKNVGGAKTYQNLIISSDSVLDDIKQKNDNFETIQVFTDRMNSGITTLTVPTVFGQVAGTGETLIKYKNDEYRLAIPRDAVVDNALTLDISAIGVSDSGATNLDRTQTFRERIKGDYAHIRLIYNNNFNINFVIEFINTIFNKNIR